MKPRRLMVSTGWTLDSGSRYYQVFSYGEIVTVTKGDDLLTAVASIVAVDASGKWFYDYSAERLYVDVGGAPGSHDIVSTYELYVATSAVTWYRDPLSESSREAFFEPVITKSPKIETSSRDILHGFMPTASSSLSIFNQDQMYNRHVYDSSFSDADVDLYHWAGEDLEVENISLFYKGSCKDVRFSDEAIDIQVTNRLGILDKTLRNNNSFGLNGATNIFNTTAYPNLDPSAINRPVRICYGMADGVVPVNVDYGRSNSEAKFNRVWIATSSVTEQAFVQRPPVSPSSTTTRTYVPDPSGFRVGDAIFLNRGSFEGAEILAVNNTSAPYYLDHTAFSTPATNSMLVGRYFIGRLVLLKGGREYLLYPEVHYTIEVKTFYKNGIGSEIIGYNFGFRLNSNLESILGLGSDYIQPGDEIYARVYGAVPTWTLGGNLFGEKSASTMSMTNGIAIIYDMLRSAGILESEIDTTTFLDLYDEIGDEIGGMFPKDSTMDMPTYKDAIGEILATLFCHMELNSDNKWTLKQIGPLGANDKTISSSEILKKSFKYDFSYRDVITDVLVEYAYRQRAPQNGAYGGLNSQIVRSSSERSKRLHKLENQSTFKSLHLFSGEAQVYADRLLKTFFDRRGSVRLSGKLSLMPVKLGDTVTIKREKLPGFDYSAGTEQERSFRVTSVSSSLEGVSLELDDQKGIEDNSATW